MSRAIVLSPTESVVLIDTVPFCRPFPLPTAKVKSLAKSGPLKRADDTDPDESAARAGRTPCLASIVSLRRYVVNANRLECPGSGTGIASCNGAVEEGVSRAERPVRETKRPHKRHCPSRPRCCTTLWRGCRVSSMGLSVATARSPGCSPARRQFPRVIA